MTTQCIHAATGLAVAAAFSASNLEPVAQALRRKYPALTLVLVMIYPQIALWLPQWHYGG